MKEFLTEWLIMYGTEWVNGEQTGYTTLWSRANDGGYIERVSVCDPSTYAGCERITPKGLEYLNDEQA